MTNEFRKPWRVVFGYAPDENPTLEEVSIRYEKLRGESLTNEQRSNLFFAYDDADHDSELHEYHNNSGYCSWEDCQGCITPDEHEAQRKNVAYWARRDRIGAQWGKLLASSSDEEIEKLKCLVIKAQKEFGSIV